MLTYSFLCYCTFQKVSPPVRKIYPIIDVPLMGYNMIIFVK